MAYLTAMTLAGLRALVRNFLHEYDEGQGNFWVDATLNRFINVAYKYYMVLTERYDPGTFVVSLTPIDVQNGVASYAISADAFSLWAIWWAPAGYAGVEVWKSPRYMHPESQAVATPTFNDNVPAYVPSVRRRGRTIFLSPTPAAAFTGALQPEVVAFPVELATDTSAVDSGIHPILHPLIAQRAAYLALAEDGENIQNYNGLINTLEATENSIIAILTGARHGSLEEHGVPAESGKAK